MTSFYLPFPFEAGTMLAIEPVSNIHLPQR